MDYTVSTNEYKGDWSKYESKGIYTCEITTKTYKPNTTEPEITKRIVVSSGLNGKNNLSFCNE